MVKLRDRIRSNNIETSIYNGRLIWNIGEIIVTENTRQRGCQN